MFVSVDALVSRTLAAYLYTSNDPLNRLDPLGLDWNFGVIAGLVSSGLGIAGLVLDAVGLPEVGIFFEGASLVAGAAAAVYDCGTGDKVGCGLDLVGLATAGVGSVGGLVARGSRLAESAKDGWEAVHGAGGAFSLPFGITGNIRGVGMKPEQPEKGCGK